MSRSFYCLSLSFLFCVGRSTAEAQTSVAVIDGFDVQILSHEPFGGAERVGASTGGWTAIMSARTGRVIQLASRLEVLQVLAVSDGHKLGTANRLEIGAISTDAQVWAFSRDKPMVARMRIAENAVVIDRVFDFSAIMFAIAELAPYGDGAILLRAFRPPRDGDSVVDQYLVALDSSGIADTAFSLGPYLPITRTRIRIKSAGPLGSNEEFLSQPFRPGAAVALGSSGTFAVADPVVRRIQLRSIVGRELRTLGSGDSGAVIGPTARAEGARLLEAVSRRTGVPIDSLPWSVPKRYQAVDRLWIDRNKIYARGPSDEMNRITVEEFDRAFGGSHRLILPAANKFRFLGIGNDRWLLGLVPHFDGTFRLARVRTIKST